MRRALAISLIVIFAFTAMIPLLMAQARGSSLPACCRAKGAHHCSLQAESPGSGAGLHARSEKCPLYPAAPALVVPLLWAELAACAAFLGCLLAAPTRAAADVVLFPVSFGRWLPKRGPPVLFA